MRPLCQAQVAASWSVVLLFQEYPGDVLQRGRSLPAHLDLETANLASTRRTGNFTREGHSHDFAAYVARSPQYSDGAAAVVRFRVWNGESSGRAAALESAWEEA